jgi:hypothetical protein
VQAGRAESVGWVRRRSGARARWEGSSRVRSEGSSGSFIGESRFVGVVTSAGEAVHVGNDARGRAGLGAAYRGTAGIRPGQGHGLAGAQ